MKAITLWQQRIQLRRKKGWKMPPNTVKVDRSTPWGNPFITGRHGTRKECVRMHMKLLSGLISLGEKNFEEQVAHLKHVNENISRLKGKNLACWCPSDVPCHADTLLKIANADFRPVKFNLDEYA